MATVNATESVQGTATAADLGIDTKGADQSWRATGTPASVADAIAAKEVPDERTDDANGDVYLLYPSGTLWLTALAAEGAAIGYYGDNDRAYNNHSGVLIRNSSWGSRVNTYRSSGGSSSNDNGFRGGGSSSGK